MDCLEKMNRTVACCFSDDCYSSQNNGRYNAALCCGSTGNTSQCKANPDLDVQARLQAVRPSVAAKSPASQRTNGIEAPIRVTCVGDSITITACASNSTMPYPQQLGRLLGPKYQVSNLGNSGKNMLKNGL